MHYLLYHRVLVFYGQRHVWSLIIGCTTLAHHAIEEDKINRLLGHLGQVAHLVQGQFQNTAQDLAVYSIVLNAALVALPSVDTEHYAVEHAALVIFHIGVTFIYMSKTTWLIETLQNNSFKAAWARFLSESYLTVAVLLVMLGVGKEAINAFCGSPFTPGCQPLLQLAHAFSVEKRADQQ